MRVIACALLLVGCGFDPATEVKALDNSLFPQCGWHKLVIEEPEAATECRLYHTEVPGCGLLPDEVDACYMEPGPKLQVNQGDMPSEWHRSGVKCAFSYDKC